jgi:hypothetical protein
MTKDRPFHKSRATTYWLSALFVLAAATACGGGGDDPVPEPAPTPAPAPGPSPAPPPPAPAPGPAPAPALPTIVDGGALTGTTQVGDTFFDEGSTDDGGQGQPVGGVNCGPVNTTFQHFTHLSIFVDGQQIALPGMVGIERDASNNLVCVYNVHTHTGDHSGRIHTEGPTQTTYTLGQFFQIWGMPLQTDNVAGITSAELTAVYIIENDTVTAFDGDPATIELTNRRHIALVLGSAITEVPVYTWN